MSGVNAVDFSNLTVTGTSQVVSTACSPVMPNNAKGAVISVQSAAIYYRVDGSDAVAAAGSSTNLNIDDVLTYDSWTYPGNNWRQVLRALRVINAGTTAYLAIEWYD